ncbi:hypothetical protein [Streptomyces bacillaris]|uniref:hypothetical protein n=1 Tax=Streptomyces bacillaris TaxID=68179 RepID=UPI003EB7EF8E
MEGHGDFDDREATSETVDAGGPFTSRFGAGRFLFLVAEHTPSGRIVGIPPLSVVYEAHETLSVSLKTAHPQ